MECERKRYFDYILLASDWVRPGAIYFRYQLCFFSYLYLYWTDVELFDVKLYWLYLFFCDFFLRDVIVAKAYPRCVPACVLCANRDLMKPPWQKCPNLLDSWQFIRETLVAIASDVLPHHLRHDVDFLLCLASVFNGVSCLPSSFHWHDSLRMREVEFIIEATWF